MNFATNVLTYFFLRYMKLKERQMAERIIPINLKNKATGGIGNNRKHTL